MKYYINDKKTGGYYGNYKRGFYRSGFERANRFARTYFCTQEKDLAKLFNLKEAAKPLNFLTDNGITNYDELAEKAENTEHESELANSGASRTNSVLLVCVR
ncbi:MAG: hypothetical protein RSD97_09725 [Lachnospiraceae bacterium]